MMKNKPLDQRIGFGKRSLSLAKTKSASSVVPPFAASFLSSPNTLLSIPTANLNHLVFSLILIRFVDTDNIPRVHL